MPRDRRQGLGESLLELTAKLAHRGWTAAAAVVVVVAMVVAVVMLAAVRKTPRADQVKARRSAACRRRRITSTRQALEAEGPKALEEAQALIGR